MQPVNNIHNLSTGQQQSPRLSVDNRPTTLLPAVLILAFALVLLIPPATIATTNSATPQSIADTFARLPVFSTPVLSPLGDKIAFETVYKGERIVATRVLGADGKTFNGKMSAIKTGEFPVERYDWANNERLVVRVRTHYKAWEDVISGRLLIAVDYDGTNALRLPMEAEPYTQAYDRINLFLRFANVLEPLWWDDQHILAELDMEPINPASSMYNFPRVHKVNIYTGKKTIIQKNKKPMWYWIADQDANVRIGVRYDMAGGKRNVTTYHKARDSKSWDLKRQENFHNKDRLIPYRIPKEDKSKILVSNYRMSNAFDHRDIEDNLFIYDPERDEVSGRYTNAFRQEILQAAKAQFPGYKVDVISMDRDDTKATLCVYSDKEPPIYFVYDRKEKALQFLSASFPHISPDHLGSTRELTYSARDGSEIPAYLTMPSKYQGDKPGLIVLPHQGPEYRDWYGFDRQVQFFARLGYAVLQPQYRGSTGFGVEHMDAGLGQWGMLMQTDVTDAARWAVDQNLVDADRICIVGTAYGGYVAALELGLHQDLYRCAISIDGILNLQYFLQRLKWNLFYSTKEILSAGYAEADKYSPLSRVKDIEQPLLIIYGDTNANVSIEHSRLMHKKMKRHKKPVSLTKIKGAGHWPTHEKHEQQKYRAIASFLEQNMQIKE